MALKTIFLVSVLLLVEPAGQDTMPELMWCEMTASGPLCVTKPCPKECRTWLRKRAFDDFLNTDKGNRFRFHDA